MSKEDKDELAQLEKSYIEKIGGGTIVTLVLLVCSLISTFAVSQYKITALQEEMKGLKADSETLISVKQEVKDMTASLNDLKEQNKETYRLLLDISKHQ